MVNKDAILYSMMVGQQIGPYHLEKLLGAGGFGGVFKANTVVRDRVIKPVALKVILGNDEQQLDELRAAVDLKHDHLIRCYLPGEGQIRYLSGEGRTHDAEVLYLPMELADGDLERHLQGRPLETEEICQIIQQVAAGLAYLHGENRVHRDLKPGNVLRVEKQWKLSDFGLVRHLGANSYLQTTKDGGTTAYMPPEAFLGIISPAWDMWSLGIMVVQMVSANLPYCFSGKTQLRKQVMDAAVELPPLPEELEPIVEGCLQVDRQERWNAEQVLEVLRPSEIKIPGSPPPVDPKHRKESTRNSGGVVGSITEDLGRGIKLELIQLAGGEFLMGASEGDSEAWDIEKPQHWVKITEFAIGKYPITQEQYQAVMGKNPSKFEKSLMPSGRIKPFGDIKAREMLAKFQKKQEKMQELDQIFYEQLGLIQNSQHHQSVFTHPVERVSWYDAQEFCRKLSQRTGKKYRLPSEAEWEYACRAGTTTRYYFGDNGDELESYAWFDKNSSSSTQRVGTRGLTRARNPWGLYDMHGNVWEWCEDRWHEKYEGAPTDGRAWVESTNGSRVLRGGSWLDDSRLCRSSYRNWFHPDLRRENFGFRVVVST